MKFITDLNLGWRKLLLSSKDFVTLSEILERTQQIDSAWVGNTMYYVIQPTKTLDATSGNWQVITKEAYDELLAAYEAAKAADTPVKEEDHV